MNPAFAQAAPQRLHPGDAGYDVLLDAATVPLREALGDRVVLEVDQMDRLGPWAFVLGRMRAPGGGRPDLSGTSFADAAEQGAMSDAYVALLRHVPGGDGEAADADAPGATGPGDQPDGDPASDGAAFPAGGQWTVLDHAIGPGDVAWLDWPAAHAAPRALFGF